MHRQKHQTQTHRNTFICGFLHEFPISKHNLAKLSTDCEDIFFFTNVTECEIQSDWRKLLIMKITNHIRKRRKTLWWTYRRNHFKFHVFIRSLNYAWSNSISINVLIHESSFACRFVRLVRWFIYVIAWKLLKCKSIKIQFLFVYISSWKSWNLNSLNFIPLQNISNNKKPGLPQLSHNFGHLKINGKNFQ